MIVRNSLGLLAASVWLTTAALARQGEGGIERCAAMASDAERIACLEDLVRQAGEPTARPGKAPDPVTGNAPAAVTEVVPDSVPEPARESATESAPVSVPEKAAEPVPGSAQEPVPRTPPDAVPAASRDQPAVDLGAEQVAVRESRDEPTVIVNAMVVAHTEVGYRKLRVELDNGQVWRQTDGDRQRVIRKLRNHPQFAVEMWATKFGGYRMHIPSENLTIRVERLQ